MRISRGGVEHPVNPSTTRDLEDGDVVAVISGVLITYVSQALSLGLQQYPYLQRSMDPSVLLHSGSSREVHSAAGLVRFSWLVPILEELL